MRANLVNILWGISFDRSWIVQKGDLILVNGEIRRIEHKEDSVVYIEPFPGSTTDVVVNFLSK
jgi:hypothetical protein